jgi:hypothetical protein
MDRGRKALEDGVAPHATVLHFAIVMAIGVANSQARIHSEGRNARFHDFAHDIVLGKALRLSGGCEIQRQNGDTSNDGNE